VLIVLMISCADGASSNFVVCPFVGRIRLNADFVAEADGGENSHGPN